MRHEQSGMGGLILAHLTENIIVSRSGKQTGMGLLELIMGFADAPAYYADGQRSILDIRDEIAAEYAPVPVEALEHYFQAFEKAGVMKISRKHPTSRP